MVFYAAFNIILVIQWRQLTNSYIPWVSTVLGRGSELSCPSKPLRKSPEDPEWLKPGASGVQVTNSTTGPHVTPETFCYPSIYRMSKGLSSIYTGI